MNVNIIGNKVFVNGSPLPPIPGAKSSVSLSQVGNRLYVNGYEYRNGRWKRTLRARFAGSQLFLARIASNARKCRIGEQC